MERMVKAAAGGGGAIGGRGGAGRRGGRLASHYPASRRASASPLIWGEGGFSGGRRRATVRATSDQWLLKAGGGSFSHTRPYPSTLTTWSRLSAVLPSR